MFYPEKVYLNVPFNEKNEAMSLGARWDNEAKAWYYMDDMDEAPFAKWAIAPMLALEDLSDEQQEMIEFAKSGCNVLVDACIGSGKTTAIQILCNELKGKKVLYLTYNTLLKIDAKEKIVGGNITTTNYHGFAYMALSRANIKAGISDLIQTFLLHKEEVVIPFYDVLVLDEYQDIEQEIAEMLECIKKKNPDIQIIAVGDMAQKIYDKTTLNVPKFINEFLGKYEKVNFTKCFRLSKGLASRLGNIWNKEINGVNNRCKVEIMERATVVSFLAKQKPSDILCLGSRTGAMADVLNTLERKHPDKFNKETVYASIRDDNGGKTLPDKSTAIFTTYDSSKGLERKICVVFDYTEDYWGTRMGYPDTSYEILRNIFCVAMSRGKERIVIVKDPYNVQLSDETIATPVMTKKDYSRPFLVSEMFDFKYKEDVEECFKLLKIQRIKTDSNVINIASNDCLIDLAPCVGIFQEASFFKQYSIDDQIRYAVEMHDNRPPIKTKRPLDETTLEEKILYLTAYNTFQDRYVEQVKTPFVTEEQEGLIHDRLKEKFNGDEVVQADCEIKFCDVLNNAYAITGRCDVLKNNVVYELKFVEELNHEHFLQCATYMVALGLKKGVLWNVKTNEQCIISIPDRRKFLQTVVRTITKGRVTSCYTSEHYYTA